MCWSPFEQSLFSNFNKEVIANIFTERLPNKGSDAQKVTNMWQHSLSCFASGARTLKQIWLDPLVRFKIYQRGVQWKQGVVICMILYTSWLYDATPIHCTPLRLHPPLQSIRIIVTTTITTVTTTSNNINITITITITVNTNITIRVSSGSPFQGRWVPLRSRCVNLVSPLVRASNVRGLFGMLS